MFDPAILLNRRTALKSIAAIAATSPLLCSVGRGDITIPQISSPQKRSIIVVADITISHRVLIRQTALFRSANFTTYYLLTGGIDNKATAASCAGTCNTWINEMARDHGVEKVMTLVWTARYGPMLTIPLMTWAHIMMVRAYGPSTIRRQPLSPTASVDPIVSHLEDLKGRMTRNGRPFLLRIETQLNMGPLFIDEIPII